VRDFQVKHWMKTFFLWVVGYYYTAAVVMTVPFYAYGDNMESNGKNVGMWTVGLMIYLLCVFFTHFLFFNYFRNFDRTIIIIGGIIWVQVIIVCFFVNAAVKTDPMYKAVWENLFRVQFWAVMFVTMTLMVLPSFLYRQVSALIVFPQFNHA